MKFINGWNYMFKEDDRFDVKIRIGTVTVFRLYFDVSDRHFKFFVMNFGVEL